MPVNPPNVNPNDDPELFEQELPEGWSRDANGNIFPPNAEYSSPPVPQSTLGLGTVYIEGVGDFESDIVTRSPPDVNPFADAGLSPYGEEDDVFEGPYIDDSQALTPDADPAIPSNRFDTATADDLAGFNADDYADFNAVGPGTAFTTSAASSPSQAAGTSSAQQQATAQDVANFTAAGDWRVRVSLAPGATYLYNASDPGILKPLLATRGVIFPYTPTVSVGYSASYDAADLTHSNFRIFFYRNSQVGDITIAGDFTAQDTGEADYMLAVIHFFRTVTKMFYGQDSSPVNGTPPPLVYLSGYGTYQFDNHPMLINSFNMSLPDSVDYIRTSSNSQAGGVGYNLRSYQPNVIEGGPRWLRLLNSNLRPGGERAPPVFNNLMTATDSTYVPTKMSISITAMPVVSRNDIANTFSVRDYATGKLLRGSQRQGGGIW